MISLMIERYVKISYKVHNAYRSHKDRKKLYSSIRPLSLWSDLQCTIALKMHGVTRGHTTCGKNSEKFGVHEIFANFYLF